MAGQYYIFSREALGEVTVGGSTSTGLASPKGSQRRQLAVRMAGTIRISEESANRN